MNEEELFPSARRRDRGHDPLRPDFTESQLAAIEHEYGACRVLAGPGSGKTTVLTHRYGRLLAEVGARPNRTLVITFTKKAAEEMLERIGKLIGGRPQRTWIGTMHSKFLSILRAEYGRVEVMKDMDLRIMLGTIQKKCDLVYTREIDQEDLLKTLDYWRINMLTPDKAIDRLAARTAKKSPEVFRNGLRPPSYRAPKDEDDIMALAMWQAAHLYEEFQRRKHAEGWVDFTDMIYETWRLLDGNERVRDKWAGAFDFILVDEFQDIDPCQWEVVKMLSAGTGNLFVVGDDDQAIYGFRGARPKILIDFDKTYDDTETIVLEDNFRCPSNIVEMSNKAISLNKERVVKEFRGAKDPVKPILIRPETLDEEGHEVVEEIARLIEDGSPPKECVVVYRTHAQSLPFEVRLMEADIPYVVRKGTCFYDIREVSDLVHYLEIAIDRFDVTSVEKISNRPSRYLAKKVIGSWRQQTGGDVEGLLSIRGLTRQQERAVGDLYEAISSVQRACQRVDRSTGEILPAGTTVELLERIDRVLGYRKWARDERSGSGKPDDDLNATFKQLWSSAASEPDVYKFLHLVRRTKEFAKKKSRSKNAVTLSTFHGVKGLEFDHVFLTGMVQDCMPHKKATTPKALEEERRLAHVGFTRTKHSVMLTCPVSEGSPSKFVEEWGLWKHENAEIRETRTIESSSEPSGEPSSTPESPS